MTNLAGIVQALIFAALFVIFINADIGWAVIYVIGGMSVISAVLLFLSKKHVRVQLRELSGTARVGEKVKFEIKLSADGFCFVPYVTVLLYAEEDIRIRTSLLFTRKKTLSGSFTAKHCGINTLSVNMVRIRDFVGLFSLRISVEQEAKKGVLPRTVEYDGPAVMPRTLLSDDEDTEEGASPMRGGLPGCEHREYVPGDSPKRVNYKLSEKRGILLVRLDEGACFSPINIFISENALPVCAEQAFALAERLIIGGGSVKIAHRGEACAANSPETLVRLREWLAFREYASGEEFDAAAPPADADVVFSSHGEVYKTAAV